MDYVQGLPRRHNQPLFTHTLQGSATHHNSNTRGLAAYKQIRRFHLLRIPLLPYNRLYGERFGASAGPKCNNQLQYSSIKCSEDACLKFDSSPMRRHQYHTQETIHDQIAGLHPKVESSMCRSSRKSRNAPYYT